MTNEERATLIRRGFLLLLATGICLGVWFFPKKQAPAQAQETIKYDIEIIHYHKPQDPESEQMADILNKVRAKYSNHEVLVTRVDITAHPEMAVAEKITKAPKVVMMANEQRACKFQGLWTQAQVERKVEEILRGLKSVGKDWRPDVHGMKPASGSPGAPAQTPPPTPAQH